MAKRFTDTEKWKKPFIRGLQGAYKLLWLYICDDCDHAGIWQVDLDVAQIRIGEKIDIKKAIESFGDKIIIFDNDNKWFIPSFIEFQYPSGLNPDNRAHNSTIILLEKYNLIDKKNKPLKSPLKGAMDMDMVKDMDMGKVKRVELNFLSANQDMVELWDEWKDYKLKHFKFKYKTIQSEKAAFDNLIELSGKKTEIAKEIVKQSMANGWKGFFELKNSQNKTLSHQNGYNTSNGNNRPKSAYELELEKKRKEAYEKTKLHDNNF